MSEILKWESIAKDEIIKTNFFNFFTEKCILPNGKVMEKYYRFEISDWVQVIPITQQGNIVLIEQYRHGYQDIFWEVPGGSIDLNESPEVAAKRELLEETGYNSSENLIFVGSHAPNPALQNNNMHCFIAKDVKKVGDQNLDPYEDIRVFEKSVKEVYDLVYSGKIQHSIVIASLLMAMPKIQKLLEDI